jgi:hypothetical protein
MFYSKPPAGCKRLCVTDGRHRCGSVEQSSGGFIAFDISGRIVGKFQTLNEAARSLPTAGSSLS